MNDEKLAQFANQKYLNLETYKKSGQGVQTPVWFAENKGLFYIYSLANAGKVKRIRNNPKVKIAPCDFRGKLKGVWIEAKARMGEGDESELAHRLLNKKYGLMKRIGNFVSKLRKRKNVVIVVQVD